MTITVHARPYVLSTPIRHDRPSYGRAYFPLTSDEAQRLIDTALLIVDARPNRVTFINDIRVEPATIGGGPAFDITLSVGETLAADPNLRNDPRYTGLTDVD